MTKAYLPITCKNSLLGCVFLEGRDRFLIVSDFLVPSAMPIDLQLLSTYLENKQ